MDGGKQASPIRPGERCSGDRWAEKWRLWRQLALLPSSRFRGAGQEGQRSEQMKTNNITPSKTPELSMFPQLVALPLPRLAQGRQTGLSLSPRR